MQPFRVEPAGKPQDYKTYQIMAPRSTHMRKATCAEVECVNWARGFRVTCDVSTGLGQGQARYITHHSGRKFDSDTADEMVTFTFPPGTECFASHEVPLEREPLFVVREGDYRGNPRGTRPITRNAADWVDDFANHQDKLADRINRG
jgi:hypothetical protein